MNKLQLLFSSILFAFIIISCEESDDNPIQEPSGLNAENYELISPVNPEAHDGRLFGINISEGAVGFNNAFNKSMEIGVQFQELNIPWNAFETEEGVYTDPFGNLAATAFYGDNNVKVALSIALINTVAWELPSYLSPVDLNTDKFNNAFNNLVDWIMETIPDNVELIYISIGNEVNYVLSGDQQWNDYTAFFESAADHIRTNYPNVKTGVKTTVTGGLFDSDKQRIIDLNEYADVVMLNYYPQNEQFEVHDPTIPLTAFDEMVSYFPDKQIYMTELGYQSGELHCNSNEHKQAEFYHHIFAAWDKHKDKIDLILIDWLHDQSPETIEEWKDYYGDTPDLIEYLATLGVLNYDGSDKAAWLQLTEETKVRAW